MRTMKLLTYRLILTMLVSLLFQVLPAQDGQQSKISEYESIIQKHQQANNTTEVANYQGKLGYLYWEAGNTAKAVEYFQKAMQNNETLGNENAIRTLASNIGLIYYEKDEYDKALTYFRKSLPINQKLKKRYDLATNYVNISYALQSLKRYDEAIDNIQKALPIFQELNDVKSMRSCYTSLSDNYEKLGRHDKSKEYFDLATSLNKQMQSAEMKKLESRTQEAEAISRAKDQELQSTKGTLEEVIQVTSEKQMEIDLLSKARELDSLKHQAREQEMGIREKQKKNVILSLVLGLIVIFIISTLIFFQLNQKKKANKLLEQRNQQISEQKKELEEQHEIVSNQKKKITDSIHYAQRIQQAILPTQAEMEKAFPEHFVLYKPRDIVSGDFYWLTEKDGVIIIAAADCTGHGVPGAFMSMLGIAYLNEIVSAIGINKHIRSLTAGDVLNQLREYFIQSLHQTGSLDDTTDGMEISLCIIDTEGRNIQFAGAHNPVYIARNKELIKLEADKMPIGISPNYQLFNTKDFKLQHNDMIYLCSDGYYDQFGGDKGLKFFSVNFRKLLLEINHLPAKEQLGILEHTIEKWRGHREQVDDMLVIGMRMILEKEPVIATTKVYSKQRVLIAEDTEMNYFLLVQALRNYNVQIFRASNGKEAVEFSKANELDLILMDINMPVMDGEEATKEIRTFNKDIPIIAQTALDLPGQKNHLIEIGCNDYISKPIDLQLFISTLKKYIEI